MTNELDAAYRATIYSVFLPGGALELRIDTASADLAAWLAAHGVTEWAILTACNPASRRLPAAVNAERQAALECALLEAGVEPFASENIAADGNWPPEESCFVPGLAPAQAIELARRFGQNAIVHGGTDGRPRLVWIESA